MSCIQKNGVYHTSAPGMYGGINTFAPMQKQTVYVNGKEYPVVKVPSTGFGIAQSYQEVVIIDGKQYPVRNVPSLMACDATSKAVIIDGKQYPVSSNHIVEQAGDVLSSVFANRINKASGEHKLDAYA